MSIKGENMNIEFPMFQTARLVLRAFQLSDAKEVQRMAGHPSVAATTSTIPHPYLDGVAEDWISKHVDWYKNGSSVDFAIELQSSQKLIGNISLIFDKKNHKAEIGYWVGVEFWNQGYCSEAMKAVIDYAFEVRGLNKITCRHMATNPASGKVMIKNGMAQEGVLKHDLYKDGRFVDIVVYGLLRIEWEFKDF